MTKASLTEYFSSTSALNTLEKITHIEFSFCRTDQHPLDEINNKKNNLKAQLADLGFKQEIALLCG
jgi:hypothetical protein